MEWIFEITKMLEDMKGDLLSRVAILNLPGPNYCEKRAERVRLDDRSLSQSCLGCVTQGVDAAGRLSLDQIRETIDLFTEKYGTKIIAIPGRGDPFHPRISEETMFKIRYGASKGLRSYVFTAGNNLTKELCEDLAHQKVNVMISLFGNRFIDADFFNGKQYYFAPKPLQNEAEIAGNLKRLIESYQADGQLAPGITRLGMNYVVSESDLRDSGAKVASLKMAAHSNNITLICNTNFEPNPDLSMQKRLEELAFRFTDRRFSTGVDGQCQMGAGSAVTVDYNGELYRCPYLRGVGDGSVVNLTGLALEKVVSKYMSDRSYLCVPRKILK